MENVQTKTETKPSASKKRARRASPVFRKIVLGKPVRLEEIDTQGTPARIAEKDRLQALLQIVGGDKLIIPFC